MAFSRRMPGAISPVSPFSWPWCRNFLHRIPKWGESAWISDLKDFAPTLGPQAIDGSGDLSPRFQPEIRQVELVNPTFNVGKVERWSVNLQQTNYVSPLALREAGMVLHEDRTDQRAKNFVDSGVVSLELAHKIISSIRGFQTKSSPHHQCQAITVWILTPKYDGRQWYVKCYLIEEDLWLLSFHD